MASVAIPTKKPKDLPDQNLTQKVELQRLQAEGGQLIPPAIVPPETFIPALKTGIAGNV